MFNTLHSAFLARIFYASCGLAAAVLLTGGVPGGRAEEPSSKARLIADVESIRPGTPFRVGILITLRDGWHTYWLNPGDSGFAPKMDWRLPDGFTAGPVLYPAPRRFDEPPLTTFGYDRDVLFVREVRPPDTLAAGTNITLAATVSWLICKEMCVPLTDRLSVTLPSRGESPLKSLDNEPLFARARRDIPAADPGWVCRASAEPKTILLRVSPPGGFPSNLMSQGVFFPSQRDLVKYGPQRWTREGPEVLLSLDRFLANGPLPTHVKGALVFFGDPPDGIRALEVNAKLLR
ncbi:MAG: hypothetical protein HY343_07200 [Lentisphaerae bacterium]|nr:hypothetical protein [Lentisphaerota bacterium]